MEAGGCGGGPPAWCLLDEPTRTEYSERELDEMHVGRGQWAAPAGERLFYT